MRIEKIDNLEDKTLKMNYLGGEIQYADGVGGMREIVIGIDINYGDRCIEKITITPGFKQSQWLTLISIDNLNIKVGSRTHKIHLDNPDNYYLDVSRFPFHNKFPLFSEIQFKEFSETLFDTLVEEYEKFCTKMKRQMNSHFHNL